MDSVRIDKWLLAARFFKSRALATHACELGRIEANGQRSKASRDVRVGDTLEIRNEGGTFQVEVLGLSDVRGSAAVAQALYRETAASMAAREKVEAERKAMHALGLAPEGRPSKRDRQQLDRVRGRG
ncbi:RNA-binding S4 domain-containing protein [Acidipila sp. EB88]|uniref:RNA-binding S4 domain-containing protein n=1 Tax=Acidipila sp. EB88 TaxID=2305226 RepID=UPI000F5DCA15|nr:RNA-binding S4 domain-containing protein [Acidipila sp. EB88]RRA47198.1 RNA-binding S4 domain-containing protein [Acidipila sp. EB88]